MSDAGEAAADEVVAVEVPEECENRGFEGGDSFQPRGDGCQVVGEHDERRRARARVSALEQGEVDHAAGARGMVPRG